MNLTLKQLLSKADTPKLQKTDPDYYEKQQNKEG